MRSIGKAVKTSPSEAPATSITCLPHLERESLSDIDESPMCSAGTSRRGRPQNVHQRSPIPLLTQESIDSLPRAGNRRSLRGQGCWVLARNLKSAKELKAILAPNFVRHTFWAARFREKLLIVTGSYYRRALGQRSSLTLRRAFKPLKTKALTSMRDAWHLGCPSLRMAMGATSRGLRHGE